MIRRVKSSSFAALGLLVEAVGIIFARFATTEGCSGESSFSDWNGWFYVASATAALTGSTYIWLTTRVKRRWAAVGAVVVALVSGLGIFWLLLLEELGGCIA
jgi:hypothetical protein